MNDQIQNQITEIFAIEDAGTRVTLRDKAKKSLGSFFKSKQDGNPTQAWQQFQDMELKSGSLVQISFKEVPYKDGKIKNIIGFRETNEQAQSYQAPPKIARTAYEDETERVAKIAMTTANPTLEYKPTEPKDDTFWNKKAYKQCLWNYWLDVKQKAALTPEQMDLVWKVFNDIEQDAENRFSQVDPNNIPF